ncbi:PIN domain-containing protein [Nonomuraea sp. NPDC005983]|uniref:PIN domain-containing protein n=1 Tax=Nonomuraea sp. NPDC005983 TaxID=3155595 RepID=UPI0033BA5417
MIVLDTNQLHHLQPPAGAPLSMLRTVAFQTGHALAVPEIALEEHHAHYAHETKELHQTATSAIRSLNARLRYSRTNDPDELQLARLMESVSIELREFFTILPTPDWAARESLLREARRLAPAKRSWDGKGEGARDAAIWLTAVDALRQSEEMIYFVSMDKRAFGEGTLLPALEEDLREEADRFRYCYGIDALLKALAKPHATKVGAAQIGSSQLVEAAVRRALESFDFFTPLLESLETTRLGMLPGFQAREICIAGKPHVISYEIGGRTWACARVRWNSSAMVWKYLSRNPVLASVKTVSMDTTPLESVSLEVSFSCSTTLLMELDNDAQIVDVDVTHVGGMRDVRTNIAT